MTIIELTKVSDSAPPKATSCIDNFDALPNSSWARVTKVAKYYDVSVPTIWRWARLGLIPKPERIGNTTRWKVGAIRSHKAGV